MVKYSKYYKRSFNMEKTNLVYDKNTKIVYYGYVKSLNLVEGFDIGHATAPYLSSNGKLCKFIDGKIVEIM